MKVTLGGASSSESLSLEDEAAFFAAGVTAAGLAVAFTGAF